MHIKDIETLADFKQEVAKAVGHKYTIEYSWTTGGTTGGSCWDEGETRNYPRQPEDEPEDESLTQILETVAPEITFLQYKKLEKEGLWDVKENYYNEYYGNSREETTKTLKLEVLFERLKEMFK
jgi:hypothetical protein